MTGAAAVVLSGSDVALFASDMHLGDHDPATARLFVDALARIGPQASHLFLLGDLFEAWVGDDQPDAVVGEALALLAALVGGGCSLFVMRGNRDFLLDVGERRFSRSTGATMLDDPSIAMLFGEPVVLAHGDALCTGDLEYQQVRRLVRSPAWQARFLAQSLAERLAAACQMRAQSERAQVERARRGRAGPADLGSTNVQLIADPASDVDPAEVDALLRASGARTLIHGHTHRPARHRWPLDQGAALRWVLSDWNAADRRGDFLRVDRRGYRRLDVEGAPKPS